MMPTILAVLGLIAGIAFSVTAFSAPDWPGLIYLFSAFGLLSVAAAISVSTASADTSTAIKVITTLNLVVFVAFFVFSVGFGETSNSTKPS